MWSSDDLETPETIVGVGNGEELASSQMKTIIYVGITLTEILANTSPEIEGYLDLNYQNLISKRNQSLRPKLNLSPNWF